MSISNNEESVLGATVATAAGGTALTAGILSQKGVTAAVIVAAIATLTVAGIIIYKKLIKK